MKGQSVKGPRPSRAKPVESAGPDPLKAKPYVPPRGMSAAMERVKELTSGKSLIGQENPAKARAK